MHKAITWAESVGSSAPKEPAEEKKVSDIINMNPFMCKVFPYVLLLLNITCGYLCHYQFSTFTFTLSLLIG